MFFKVPVCCYILHEYFQLNVLCFLNVIDLLSQYSTEKESQFHESKIYVFDLVGNTV